MLQLNNATPFAANLMLLPDRQGVTTLFAVVKGTFSIVETEGAGSAEVRVAEEQVSVALADEYHGEPGASSIRVASDVCLGKPGTDILMIGSAWAPSGRPVWQMDVGLGVGSVSRTVRVSGDRVWDAGPAGATMKWVAPFVRMPLVWERAYGGADETDKGPAADRRNPVGTGFRAPGGTKALAGLAVPNIEDPAAPISSPADRPPPAGFGPLAPHWEPRCLYGGTYDDAWRTHRAPYLPDDFDPRFFQLAAPGLTTPVHLNPGEWVQVLGATPTGQLQFQLPPVRIETSYVLDGRAHPVPAGLDTVIIEPDERRVVLVWRAALRCDKKALRVSEVRATALSAA